MIPGLSPIPVAAEAASSASYTCFLLSPLPAVASAFSFLPLSGVDFASLIPLTP